MPVRSGLRMNTSRSLRAGNVRRYGASAASPMPCNGSSGPDRGGGACRGRVVCSAYPEVGKPLHLAGYLVDLAMLYKITIERDYLKADLFNRETVMETQEFFDIVADSAQQYRRKRILIS